MVVPQRLLIHRHALGGDKDRSQSHRQRDLGFYAHLIVIRSLRRPKLTPSWKEVQG
jgi:hypothetical protein